MSTYDEPCAQLLGISDRLPQKKNPQQFQMLMNDSKVVRTFLKIVPSLKILLIDMPWKFHFSAIVFNR